MPAGQALSLLEPNEITLKYFFQEINFYQSSLISTGSASVMISTRQRGICPIDTGRRLWLKVWLRCNDKGKRDKIQQQTNNKQILKTQNQSKSSSYVFSYTFLCIFFTVQRERERERERGTHTDNTHTQKHIESSLNRRPCPSSNSLRHVGGWFRCECMTSPSYIIPGHTCKVVACPQFLALGPVNLAHSILHFPSFSVCAVCGEASKCNIPSFQVIFAAPLYERCWEQCARCIISSMAAWQTAPALRLWAPHLCIAPESWTEWTLMATSSNRHGHTLLIRSTFALHLSCCMSCVLHGVRRTCGDLTFE